MINTQFPINIENQHNVDLLNFVLPNDLQDKIISLNHDLEATGEFRLQPVYSDELWLKVRSLGLENFDWKNSCVLDVASGEGFLSYHLLQRVNPKDLVLAELSPTALEASKSLLQKSYPNSNISYTAVDVLKSKMPDNSFDIIIGNSFIHHFYNLPEAFSEFYRLLKPGGIFVSLHEPLVGAVAYESGRISYLVMWLLRGSRYINDIRKIKGDFALNNNPGGDVWLFEKNDLNRLLTSAGFSSVSSYPWHITRPFFVGLFNICLSSKKTELNKFEIWLLNKFVAIDKALTKFLPANFFGSISICAKK